MLLMDKKAVGHSPQANKGVYGRPVLRWFFADTFTHLKGNRYADC